MPDAPPKQFIPLEYRDLAQWAETADGLRGVPLVIAEIEENGKVRRALRRKEEVKPEQIVVDDIQTKQNSLVRKLPVTEVIVEVNGKPGKPGTRVPCKSKSGIVCDAVFCTDSAIEKFLFLYYRAQRLLTDDEWGKLEAARKDPKVIAIGHIWPSSSVEVPDPTKQGLEEAAAAPRSGTDDDRFYVLETGKLGIKGGIAWSGLSEYTPPTGRGSVP